MLETVSEDINFPDASLSQRMLEQQRTLRHVKRLKPLLATGIVENALSVIPPDIEYSEWIAVGMALHAAGYPLQVWDDWSARGQKYTGSCSYHWSTFTADYGIGVGTLFHIAREHGWDGKIPTPEGEEELTITDPTEFNGLPIPERAWIVPEWLPVGCTTSLYGVGGTGKSLVVMGLMTAAAIGKPWLGMEVQKVKAIGLFCEDPPEELQRRQNAINLHYGISFSDCSDMRWVSRVGQDNTLLTFDKQGRPQPTDFYHLFENHVLEFGAKLVIVDTAADTFSGNENDRSQVRHFISLLTRLALKIDGSVLLCAHPSRSGESTGSGDSGSTAWSNSVRSRWLLERPKADDVNCHPDIRIIRRMKANYAARDAELYIAYRNHAFVPLVSTELQAACNSRAERDADIERYFLSALVEAVAQGRNVSHISNSTNYAPKFFLKAGMVSGATRKELEEAMQRLFARKAIVIHEYGRKDQPSKALRLAKLDAPQC